MPAAQQLLFPDPRPLVERLGSHFFRQLPDGPGVYLMHGFDNQVLYVGKAKNLRRRLGCYRVANPDRLPRRHLRLLRSVTRIEWQNCESEQAALSREAELLRNLKPKFNRAGTWSPPPRYLAYRIFPAEIQFTVTETPAAEWNSHGPMGARARVARIVLTRLVWALAHPHAPYSSQPVGWTHGCIAPETSVRCAQLSPAFDVQLAALLSGQSDNFVEWVMTSIPENIHGFEKALLAADLELLTETFKPASAASHSKAVLEEPQTSVP